MSRPRVVVVGAGNIGCGYLCEQLLSAGYAVTLVTHEAAQATRITRAGGVRVRLRAADRVREVLLGPVEAVPCSDRDTVRRRVAAAFFVAVSVGGDNLPAVAVALRPGLLANPRPVNVVAFENRADAGTRLRTLVTSGSGADDLVRLQRHGYVSALVDRVVTRRSAPDGAVVYLAEDRPGVVLDAAGVRAPLPVFGGLRVVRRYDAHVLAKLAVFSAGHAAAAYLGAARGHHYLADAVADPAVRAAVHATMAEGQAGLAARYGDQLAGGLTRRVQELARFGDRVIADTVPRVGRDPLRKLAVGERILGTARLATEAGVRPVNLAMVAAAALRFACTDPGSFGVAADLARHGVPFVLEQRCGLPPGDAFGVLVAAAWRDLVGRGAAPGSRPGSEPGELVGAGAPTEREDTCASR